MKVIKVLTNNDINEELNYSCEFELDNTNLVAKNKTLNSFLNHMYWLINKDLRIVFNTDLKDHSESFDIPVCV